MGIARTCSVSTSIRSMKKVLPTRIARWWALLVIALIVLAACEPGPEVHPMRGKVPNLHAQGDTIHDRPDSICGNGLLGSLVDAMGQSGDPNPFSPGEYGSWELISTPDSVFLQITLARGWQISAYSVYQGELGNIPRNSTTQLVDWEAVNNKGTVDPTRNIWEIAWPISSDLRCPNSIWTAVSLTVCEIDFASQLFNCRNLYLGGTAFSSPLDNSGALGVTYCAESCLPPCVLPTPGPGGDLSPYACGDGLGEPKVTICHLPPGYPANMQEICISVSALEAHVLDFKPLNNPCLGHHSGCHIGPCDPCGPGSSSSNVPAGDPCPGNGGYGGSN